MLERLFILEKKKESDKTMNDEQINSNNVFNELPKKIN